MKQIMKSELYVIVALTMFISVILSLMGTENVNAKEESFMVYPVVGGNIYFDSSTGTIIDCDSGVTAVTIPNDIDGIPVVAIGKEAFYLCDELKTVTMNNNVSTIGKRAFAECTSLANVSFAEGLKNIEASAFIHCDALADMIIPDSVESIGDDVFRDCDNLKHVTFSKSIKNIGSNLFHLCSNLKRIDVNEDNPQYASISGVLVDKIKRELLFYPAGKSDTSYRIPDGIVNVGKEAFYECNNIKRIFLTNSMKSIGENAFFQMNSLEEVIMPDSIEKIGSGAFWGCKSLKDVKLPNSVTEIGNGAFLGCLGLTDIIIPDSVVCIKSGAFSACRNLVNVEISEGVTTIGANAFYECIRLKKVEIPESVTMIGEDAFAYCDSLKKVTIPSSVQSLSADAFCSCRELTNISVETNNSRYISLDGVLFNKAKTTLMAYPAGKPQGHYTIPESVNCISEKAFRDVKYLKDVIIPEGVKKIGAYTFLGMKNLKCIVIPPSVIDIDIYAFKRGSEIKSFVIYGIEGCFAQTYAAEKEISFKTVDEYIGIYSVMFDAAGGTVDVTTKDVTSKELYGELPVPKREGYIFDGWYTEREGGMRITSETIVNLTDNQTLYAHWNKEAIDIGELTYSSIPAKVYTGKPQTPLPVLKDGNYVLQKGKDYTISYENNINAGTAKIIFTGIGSYSGTVIKNFTIKKAEQMIHTKACIKTYGNKPFSLRAKAKTKLSYKSSNTKVVAIGNTGRVTLKGPGKATITITAAATANYNGATKHVTITVKPKKTVGLKVKKGKNRMTVSWKRDKKATGYQIAYAQTKRFKKGKKNITISKNKTVKKTIKKLKARKTYYVKVRAYKKVGKTKIYGAYSKMKTIKVK